MTTAASATHQEAQGNERANLADGFKLRPLWVESPRSAIFREGGVLICPVIARCVTRTVAIQLDCFVVPPEAGLLAMTDQDTCLGPSTPKQAAEAQGGQNGDKPEAGRATTTAAAAGR